MSEFDDLLTQARELSYQHYGKEITFYIPGMFTYFGEKGNYPSVSLTGSTCELQCNHCKGKLLETMIQALTPDDLIKTCEQLAIHGCEGVLLTGGCSLQGYLPWKLYIQAITHIKKFFPLLVSVHTGLLELGTAMKLKKAGVDQALIDMIGDNETWKTVYHIDQGVEKLNDTLLALRDCAIPLVPHIVIGLNYGKIRGEYIALEMLQSLKVDALVFVSLMPLSGTPMKNCQPPSAQDIVTLMAKARVKFPKTILSLGCARERGNHQIDLLALESGINRIAIPSEKTVARAKEMGLTIHWKKTCCSVK
jgi:lipoyl synthase